VNSRRGLTGPSISGGIPPPCTSDYYKPSPGRPDPDPSRGPAGASQIVRRYSAPGQLAVHQGMLPPPAPPKTRAHPADREFLRRLHHAINARTFLKTISWPQSFMEKLDIRLRTPALQSTTYRQPPLPPAQENSRTKLRPVQGTTRTQVSQDTGGGTKLQSSHCSASQNMKKVSNALWKSDEGSGSGPRGAPMWTPPALVALSAPPTYNVKAVFRRLIVLIPCSTGGESNWVCTVTMALMHIARGRSQAGCL